ncbi:glycosyltransferase [Pseudoflavitalea sp. X16]|uniref:glycosyltransferase family protein n=1 Tax=Paraflavitalea devenefica TaxID=2716334 RepID=UPI00141FA40A|nr:glycosyltransferase [Paraflavitalea devenefica]NII28347.1 glycosyltransferase [Paraflavitalea devenefica]
MIIAFVHNNKAFLPELDAYQRFFAGYGITCITTTPAKLGGDRDVDWWLMGTDLYKPQPGIYRIHEYASGSVPPARQWKDLAKRFLNTRPHYRLFLNAYVKDIFSFRDNVPYGFRDMGLWPEQLSTAPPSTEKLYDFIYVGSVRRDTQIERLLDHFAARAPLAGRSLLVVSREYEHLRSKYSSSANIVFKGPVAQSSVLELIQQARFAINYKPDIAPHNRQTSTKLLEYAACRTPIVTTHFAWMRDFQARSGGHYFYLEPDLSNFTWEKVQAFDYSFPDLTEWMWEKQIRGSGVVAFLQEKFPEAFR